MYVGGMNESKRGEGGTRGIRRNMELGEFAAILTYLLGVFNGGNTTALDGPTHRAGMKSIERANL